MSNYKTVMCRNWQKGACRFGKKCRYAHGEEELRKRKIDEPCWWHNTIGCTKSAEECVYNHVKAPGLRKPLHLQRPCLFHHKLGGCSKKGCKQDHFDLTDDEWDHHWPTSKSTSKSTQKQIVERVAPVQPQITGVWATVSDAVKSSDATYTNEQLLANVATYHLP